MSRMQIFEPLEARRLLNAIPVGSEFQVNTTTAGDQFRTSIAADADGDFVVAWQSPDGTGSQDGNGIFAQRYNSSGVAQGGEFRVNPTVKGNQQFPSSAMDADGDFVVVYGEGDVFGRRYNAAGVAQGSSFRVNSVSKGGGGFFGPDVAMNASGGFVVAWSGSGVQSNSNKSDIFVRRYNASGAPLGAEIPVTNFASGGSLVVDVAADDDGDFVVTWTSANEVNARRFNSAGVPQGSHFLVNTNTANSQGGPSVALDADGDFIITWYTYQDESSVSIGAQRYNSAGVAQGGEFQVNTYTTDTQSWPEVAMDALGNSVIVWHSYGQEAPGTWGIFAQCYDSTGTAQGSEFHVNTYTTLGQQYPAVAMADTGDFIVNWHSNGQDGSGWGIYAQRYAPAVPASAATSPFGPAPRRDLFADKLLGSEQEEESILEI